MTKFLQRCRGAGGKRPPHLSVRAVLVGGFGGFLAIGALALLSARFDVMLLLGSFGASCVLTNTPQPGTYVHGGTRLSFPDRSLCRWAIACKALVSGLAFFDE